MNVDFYVWMGLGLYFLVLLIVFLRGNYFFRSRPQRNIVDDALGNRRYGSIMVATMIVATMLGPADAIALSQKGFDYGLMWAIFPAGAALAQLVAGLFFVGKIWRPDVDRHIMSIGDIFSEKYGARSRLAAGLVTFAQSIAFAAVLILAGGQVLAAFVGMNVYVGMALTAIFVALYTAIGGMNAVVETDKVQGGFIAALALLALAAILSYAFAGEIAPRNFVTPNFSTDYSVKVMVTTFIAYFLGELLLPAYAIRALLADSAKSARNGFLLAALLLTIWYIVITLSGTIGTAVPPEQRLSGDSLVLMDVLRSWTPLHSAGWHAITIFVVAGLLALIHSTFDSFLNSGGVAFGRDVMGSLMKIDETMQSWIARLAMLSIAAFGLLIAALMKDLIDILLIGYTIWVPTLLVPFIFAITIRNRELSSVGFWLAVLAGGGAWFLFEHVIPIPVPGILMGALANLLVMAIFTFVLAAPDRMRSSEA